MYHHINLGEEKIADKDISGLCSNKIQKTTKKPEKQCCADVSVCPQSHAVCQHAAAIPHAAFSCQMVPLNLHNKK